MKKDNISVAKNLIENLNKSEVESLIAALTPWDKDDPDHQPPSVSELYPNTDFSYLTLGKNASDFRRKVGSLRFFVDTYFHHLDRDILKNMFNWAISSQISSTEFISKCNDICDKFLKTSQIEITNTNALTFKQLQEEHKTWGAYNFDYQWPDREQAWKPVFGVMEELGELAHAILKQTQGIRGSFQENEIKAQDAIGDITVFLASVCSAMGWDFQELVEKTWNEVKVRDYKKNKNGGKVESEQS